MNGRRAFTLVETIVALAVGLLVLAAAAGLLRLAWSTFFRTQERSDPREQANLALTTLAASLRDAWHYAIDPDGARIRFTTPRLDGQAVWDKDAHTLVLHPPGSPGRPVTLATSVLSFKAEPAGPGCVQLTLELARPGPHGRLATLGPVRVALDVFVPAVGLRRPSVPWNRALEHRSALEPSG